MRHEEVSTMAEQPCPRCQCVIRGEGYEKKGRRYCCERCAEYYECECIGCGAMAQGG